MVLTDDTGLKGVDRTMMTCLLALWRNRVSTRPNTSVNDCYCIELGHPMCYF